MSILTSSEVNVIPMLLLLGFSVCITFTDGIQAVQRSVFNYNTADLAIDGDVKTCSISGWDTGGWWKCDLGQARAILGVTIIGDLSSYQLRAGNLSEPVGMRRGFDDNPLCQLVIQTNYMQPQTVICRQVLVGQYISIQMVDPVNTMQMKLCEVNVIYA